MSTAEPLLLVFSTAPDADVAQVIAGALVSEGLAACVTCLPGATSTYSWQGKLETSSEVQLLIKTSAGCFQKMQERLCALHPYEVPEVLAVDLAQGLPAYLDWVRESLDGEREA